MTQVGLRSAAPMPGEAQDSGGPVYRIGRCGPAAQANAKCLRVSAGAVRLPPAARQVSDDPGREE
jgi:hypothetical protein